MTTGERIRYFRKALDLDQGVAAGLARISQQAISQVEAGRNGPTFYSAIRIAAALNVPLDALVDRPDNDPAQYLVAAGEPEPMRKLKAC